MIAEAYLNEVRNVLNFLEKTQLEAVEKASDFVVSAWNQGGVVYCHRFGHGIEGDSIYRAGGLASVQRFAYTFSVDNVIPACRKEKQADPDSDLKMVRAVIENSNLKSGDVILVSSVSGRNREPIEIALACRAKGVKVISFSSLAYAAKAKTLHPSGKSLSEVVDINIDIGAPYGDASVEVPGIDVKVMPVSGVSMACCAWMIWGSAMEKAAAAGNPPSVLTSHNREGGPAYNEKSMKQFHQRGY